MKKLVYILSALVLGLGACDPLEDTYNELDKTVVEKGYTLTVSLTPTEYTMLKNVPGAGNVAKNNNFNSLDSVKAFVPVILNKLYPQLGKGTTALVTYDIYNPVKINRTAEFTLAAEDYTAIGINFPNLSSEAQIFNAVKYKYPNPEEEDVVTLTYAYRSSGVTTTQTSKLAYIDGSWYISFVPTADDYKALGQGFTNFDNVTTAKTNFGIYFGKLYPYNKAGDIRTAIYTYTYSKNNVRVYEDRLAVLKFDGAKWVALEDVTKQSLQFGKENGVWVPDNTVKYTLTSTDYTEIGKIVTDAAAKESVTKYGNFDSKFFSEADVIKYLGARLKTLFPNAEVGQKYLVSFKTFNPSGTATRHLILNASGTYELVK